MQVSIVSAGTRQRFCIPLGFHGFTAPRAIVRHALQTCMSAHILELGRPSVARPVFAVVFGPQTGAQKNHFFPKALRRVLPENPLNTDTSTLTLAH